MANLINSIQNSGLAAITRTAPGHVINAIQKASSKTGVDFAYLVQQAKTESSFDPAAKAKTSSASGLYQFIERTWLSMVDRYGDKHGIETDGKSRKELLNLRNDPKAASVMAAEFAGENKQTLERNWGGDVGSTELYMAHFLGAGGASSFLKARDSNPLQEAAAIFPKAARANRSVFYDTKTGRAKSLEEIYQRFDKKFTIKNTQENAIVASASYANTLQSAPTPEVKPSRTNINVVIADSYVRRTNNNPFGFFQLKSPTEIMLMADLKPPMKSQSYEQQPSQRNRHAHNSLYNN